jgi:hypothetical protein
MTDWLLIPVGDFRADVKPQPLTLYPAPDPAGTIELDTDEGDADHDDR